MYTKSIVLALFLSASSAHKLEQKSAGPAYPTSAPTGYAKDKQGIPHIDGTGAYNPGASKMDPNASVWQRASIHDGKIHGEKTDEF